MFEVLKLRDEMRVGLRVGLRFERQFLDLGSNRIILKKDLHPATPGNEEFGD